MQCKNSKQKKWTRHTFLMEKKGVCSPILKAKSSSQELFLFQSISTYQKFRIVYGVGCSQLEKQKSIQKQFWQNPKVEKLRKQSHLASTTLKKWYEHNTSNYQTKLKTAHLSSCLWLSLFSFLFWLKRGMAIWLSLLLVLDSSPFVFSSLSIFSLEMSARGTKWWKTCQMQV